MLHYNDELQYIKFKTMLLENARVREKGKRQTTVLRKLLLRCVIYLSSLVSWKRNKNSTKRRNILYISMLKDAILCRFRCIDFSSPRSVLPSSASAPKVWLDPKYRASGCLGDERRATSTYSRFIFRSINNVFRGRYTKYTNLVRAIIQTRNAFPLIKYSKTPTDFLTRNNFRVTFSSLYTLYFWLVSPSSQM